MTRNYKPLVRLPDWETLESSNDFYYLEFDSNATEQATNKSIRIEDRKVNTPTQSSGSDFWLSLKRPESDSGTGKRFGEKQCRSIH